MLMPKKVKHREARELARSEFVSQTASDRTRRIDILFFVSLAERLNLPLVTSDKKLLSAFPHIAVSMNDFIA